MVDMLRKRLEELKAQRDEAVEQVVQWQHNVSALNGAIEECERTIKLVAPKPEVKSE
jgi:hypothetical protein